MIIKQEISLEDFGAWSGAKDTLQTLRDKGLCDRLENLLEDIEPEDGWTETALNDLLWFEGDYIAELLGFEDWEDLERDGEEEEEDEDEDEEEEEENMTQLQKLRRYETTNATLTVKHETVVNWTNWIGGETVTTSYTYKPGDVVWLHTWRPEGMMVKADGAPEMFVMWKYISQMFGEEI